MKIQVTVTARLEPDSVGEEGSPEVEQNYWRVEIQPELWVRAVADLGYAAVEDVARMVHAAVAPQLPQPAGPPLPHS